MIDASVTLGGQGYGLMGIAGAISGSSASVEMVAASRMFLGVPFPSSAHRAIAAASHDAPGRCDGVLSIVLLGMALSELCQTTRGVEPLG